MTAKSSFWDRIAKRYAKQPIADQAAYERKLSITREFLASDSDVLEFGCGTGGTAILHAPFVKQITAIDISENMIKIARGKAKETDIENVEFRCCDMDDLVLMGASYDVVLGLSILHLMEDMDATVSKVFDVLKPGGYFISSTICLREFPVFLRAILPVGRFLGLLPFVSFLSKEELLSALEKTGFAIKKTWQPEKRKAVFIVVQKPR